MTLAGCWTDENRLALEAMLARDYPRSPIAVFDWDNTCILGDIGDLTFHQLCRDLAFRFDTPGFWDWVSEVMPLDLVSGAYDDYCRRPGAETKFRLRFNLELQRLAWKDGPDDNAMWAWDTGAFMGWTEDEVRAYTRRVIVAETQHPIQAEILELDGERIDIPRGVRARSEISELAAAMQRRGWDVWVISASPRWELEVFAGLYGIPASHVVGMGREVKEGRITSVFMPPCSHSDGKLDAYQMFVARDRPPSFAAGDSEYDWKLLEWAEDTRLVVEPAPEKLRDFARWSRALGETWLLQRFE